MCQDVCSSRWMYAWNLSRVRLHNSDHCLCTAFSPNRFQDAMYFADRIDSSANLFVCRDWAYFPPEDSSDVWSQRSSRLRVQWFRYSSAPATSVSVYRACFIKPLKCSLLRCYSRSWISRFASLILLATNYLHLLHPGLMSFCLSLLL